MADSFYKLRTPIPAVALGLLTSTLFEFIPAGAVVRIHKQYQETGLVELQWADSCYITYFETLKTNADAQEQHSTATDAITSPNSADTVTPNAGDAPAKSCTPPILKYHPRIMMTVRLALAT